MSIAIAIPELLKNAEELIFMVVETLKKEDLDSYFTLTDRDDLVPGIPVSEVKLAMDGVPSYLNFLSRYYSRLEKTEKNPLSFFTSKNEAPTFLDLMTTDRLVFVDACRKLAQKLDGAAIKLVIDASWLWDRECLQPDGSSTHRTVFKLQIFLDEKIHFNAELWLKTAFKNICLSKDERANACMFQHFRATTGKRIENGSYEFNNRGVKICFESESLRDLAIEKSFQGCEVKKLKKTKEGSYPLEVVFPQ